MTILITGGAGFVGSSLALAFAREGAGHDIIAFDNLRRRGGEFNLPLLKAAGVKFVHGDIRQPGDLEDLEGHFDVLIEASAEPSVHAGMTGGPGYVLGTNLTGTLNCLEFARRRAGGFVFLSTSRVYAIAALRAVVLDEEASRFTLSSGQKQAGVSVQGVSEAFSTEGQRSFYGASKLASELVIQEYASAYGLPCVVNRCGVIAGPGQWGKTDQGVFSLWVAHHFFGKPLKYTGFGGTGKQVRDLLHPLDLYDLLKIQLARLAPGDVSAHNVGGGLAGSVSLREWTEFCREVTGHEVEIPGDPSTAAVDVPSYISDTRAITLATGWEPRRSPQEIARDVADWLRENRTFLAGFFA